MINRETNNIDFVFEVNSSKRKQIKYFTFLLLLQQINLLAKTSLFLDLVSFGFSPPLILIYVVLVYPLLSHNSLSLYIVLVVLH